MLTTAYTPEAQGRQDKREFIKGQEVLALNKRGEDTIKSVRQSLLANLPNLPEQHRAMIIQLWAINT